jgi:hypothetical protein
MLAGARRQAVAGSRARGSRGGVGVWIDHTQAIFVRLAGSAEPEVSSVRSEAQVGGRGGPAAPGESKEQADSRQAKRRRQQLREFYARVIEAVASAPRIVVLGPGTAKLELRQQIEESPEVARRLEQVRPCERVATRQLIERVRELLAASPPARARGRGAASRV